MATVYLLYYLLYSAYIKHNKKLIRGISCQSPERMTVNHDVTGSSPVGGAKREQSSNSYSVFVYPIESNWARRRVFYFA